MSAGPGVPGASTRITLEVCVDTLSDALVAADPALGVDRLELCSALSLSGLTPSVGMVSELAAALGDRLALGFVFLVRTHASESFAMDRADVRVAAHDMAALARAAKEAGGSGTCARSLGVAFGVLTPDREIDIGACRELLDAARGLGLSSVFHRAIDLTRDPLSAALRARDLGFDRVLTSGGAPTALAGAATLARMRVELGPRAGVVAAGSIRAANAGAVLAATGCTQLHSACTPLPPLPSLPHPPADDSSSALGAARFGAGTSRVSAAEIAGLRGVLDSCSTRSPARG